VDLGTGRSAVTIDVGTTHSCALLDDASIKCWGAGNRGALGTGDTVDRGDDPGEMGDALPPADLVF
jgi:alpha-tubulin suppressor-like RCC1 family protein